MRQRISRAIAEQAGLDVVVDTEGNGRGLVLSGRVDSPAARQAAQDIASALAPGTPISNDLEVEVVQPPLATTALQGDQTAANTPQAVIADLPSDVAEIEAADGELQPDFTDQALDTTGIEDFAEPLPLDTETTGILDETENVGFPPTDPVVTTDASGDAQVLGGFAATSLDDVPVARSALDAEPGDEALADAVRRELHEDAATTDLAIEVTVERGVAYLRGTVAGPEDADNAETIAGNVPGVRGVVEELEVRALRRAP
jgi:osmotically-inducible protein OsmY